MSAHRSMFAMVMLASASAASAQPAPTAKPCAAAEKHQLDFWVGDWTVFDTAKGYQAGTSKIEAVAGGCAIRESFAAPEAPGGTYAGTSYSAFNSNEAKWHQFYVDTNGNATWYAGSFVTPDMVLFAPGKAGVTQRMTYHPLPDGSVEQIGVISTDGGKSWQPGYDYTYRRK